MLREVRVNAGLGDPPAQFFTNVPESANAIIKRAVSSKETEMASFCSAMEDLIRHQRADVESAIVNKGPYKLSKRYEHFSIPSDKWFRMDVRQRQQHLRRFHKSQEEVKDQEGESTEKQGQAAGVPIISIQASNAGITSMPRMTVENMFRRAEELLSRNNAILPAPGNNSSFMVESATSKRPHYVTYDEKTNKVTCDDCPAWNSFKICSHSLAVAEKLGKIKNFLQWHSKKAPPANLTKLVTSDTAKGVGQKGSKAATSRRRGGRYSEPTSTIPHLPMQCEQHLQQTAEEQQTTRQPNQSVAQDQYNSASFIQHARQSTFPVPSYTPTPYNQDKTVPSPPSGVFELHLLQRCPSQVSVCFGCGQVLKPGGFIGNPPCDLVVVSRMSREYYDQNRRKQSREGNVYFHALRKCIQQKQPYFTNITIPLGIEMVLTPIHETFIGNEFGITFF